MKKIHYKCRNNMYIMKGIGLMARANVPDDAVSWDVEFDYRPKLYTHVSRDKKQPWEDPLLEDPSFKPKWNTMDGDINRQSHMGPYTIDHSGYPLNPIGRTGIRGKGILGRWAPNHAADPIVTRWKRDFRGEIEIHKMTKKPVLQFVAIQRKDTKEWAIPGGMVDKNEKITSTLKREFMEEALNSLEKSVEHIQQLKDSINKLFSEGDCIYEGYVDDPRNTDNSWMETVAFNFHDEDDSSVGGITLQAGDDAADVRWMDVGKELNLYANHSEFIECVAKKRDAHW